MAAPRKRTLSVVVLAAGRSRRFKGSTPKVLQTLSGRSIIGLVVDNLRGVHKTTKIAEVCIVVAPGKQVEKAVSSEKLPFKVTFATQTKATGTGDAARIGLRKLGPADDVLVVAADMPLVSAGSLSRLVTELRDADASISVLTAIDGPRSYGRVIRDMGRITGVVEDRDTTPEQSAIREVNLSIYAFRRDTLERVLPKLKADNAQKERYLTDTVGEIVAAGETLTSVEAPADEAHGTNTRGEFAVIARLVRERIVADLMDSGVMVVDPDATYVDAGVKVGPDTVLHPNTFLEGTTMIGAGAQIGPNTRLIDTSVGDGAVVTFSVAREAKIGPDASVGPFASLRPGVVLARGAHVGTFAEMKNARIGEGAKVPHFSYLGDVTVGKRSNIAAGTITSNYDGKKKHKTTIGDDVFIGSDTVLIAPVRVGSGAYTGSGSVVTKNVGAGQVVYGVPASPKAKARKAKAKPKPKRRR